MIRAYLDNNATTRPHEEVVEAMMPYLAARFLNASTIASDILEGGDDPMRNARVALMELLGADEPGEFVLTSGASEGNSWVVRLAEAGDHIVTSSIEHPSIRRAITSAISRGVLVDQVDPEPSGRVDPDKLVAAIRADTRLLSVILANNETGVLQPLGEVARRAREIAPDLLIHTDATQAVGRIPIDLGGTLAGVDLLSLSAHKQHGPKGMGALFIRSGVRMDALIHGEQEDGWRGGTYNSMGAAGMAAAIRLAARRLPEWAERVEPLRTEFEKECLRLFPGAFINGGLVERLPNTVSLTIPGLDANDAVERLALQGICIGSGSACSAGANTVSPILLAMGLSSESAAATIRVSMSVETQPPELEMVIGAITALCAERGRPAAGAQSAQE